MNPPENYEFLKTFVSPLIAGTLVALITGLFQWILRSNDFKNEYYKKVIYKRMDAYELVNLNIINLKSSHYDTDDKKAYHFIFAYDLDYYHEYLDGLRLAIASGNWLSDKLIDKLVEINSLLNKLPDSVYRDDSPSEVKKILISFGKENYIKIAELRSELESVFTSDLIDLYKVEKFLRSQKKLHSYRAADF